MRTVTVTFSVFEPPGGFAAAVAEATAAVGVVAVVVAVEECESRCEEEEAGEACTACWVAKGGGSTGLVVVVGVDTEILRRLVVVPGEGVVVVVGVLEPAWWF